MNRREAISASIALLFSGTLPRSRRGHVAEGFDPLFVWRESARFDREVYEPIQARLAKAMFESLDRQWGVKTGLDA